MDGGDQYFQKEISPKNPHNVTCQILLDQWKMISCWCYYGNYKLIALELHNNCFYIVVTELHGLHMYTISHMLTTHATCLIAFTPIEICWVANDHCNSKTQLQG